MLQAITNLDLSILLEIQEHLRCGFSDVIFPVLSKLNNAGFIWIVITLVLLYRKKTRTAGLCMAVCLLVNLALGEGILKHLLNRARPFVVHPISQMLIALPTTSSFPSGHTSSSFAAATALLRNHKRAGMAAYVLFPAYICICTIRQMCSGAFFWEAASAGLSRHGYGKS